jgi:uncharacterized protein
LRLVVFVRAPVAGQVKSRLVPALGPHGAAALYERLARACIVRAAEAAIGAVELWCTPDIHHPFFAACQREFGVSLHLQQGADLGERMADAVKRKLPGIIIGSDCPSLTAADLRAAAAALQQGWDAVLGPAEDGGYVLLGMRRYDSSLFAGLAWGTGQVLAETRARLRRLGWRWQELAERWDVDLPEDLQRLGLPL